MTVTGPPGDEDIIGEMLQAGHAGYASIIRQGEAEEREGYVHIVQEFKKREDYITVYLAAKAAVELALGNAINIGCSRDISRSMEEIKWMMPYGGQYGLEYTELYNDFAKEAPETRRKLDDKIHAVADQHYEKARSILCEHRDMLDQLAEKLMKDGYILASEIRAICHPSYRTQTLSSGSRYILSPSPIQYVS